MDTKKLLNPDADDRSVVLAARALDGKPSRLLYGVDDPTKIWKEGEARRASTLNSIWRSATEGDLNIEETGQLFDTVMLARGRSRHGDEVTPEMADAARERLFSNRSGGTGQPQTRWHQLSGEDPFLGEES